MADAALSVTASPLAALLTGAPADSHSGSATAQPSDPFAALLASATASPAETKSATTTADAVAALLASAAKVVTPPPVTTSPATVTTLPMPVDARPAEAEAASPVADHADKDDKDDKDAETGDPSDDPLADAIASGATAVLALAPMMVAPVQPQPPATTPTPTPIKIDAPIGMAKRVPLAGMPVGRPFKPVTQFAAGTNAKPLDAAQTSAASAAATTANTAEAAQTNADMASVQAAANVAKLDVAQAKADSSSAQADSRTPQPATTDAPPAKTALSPEMVKAAMVALKQGDGATAAADRTTGVEEAPVAPTPIAQAQGRKPQSPTVQQVQNQTAPAPAPAPVRRRGDEVAAPRRTGDTRKRVETTVGDTAAAGLGQRAEPAMTFGRAATVQPKGDAVVEQSLTIARDGAWLDTLARDIASSAGNGGDLRFKLEPQNLGSLTVAISQSDDGASIRMTADKETTRNLLLDAQPKLIAEARAQGLKVSDTHVDLKQDQSQNQNQHQNPAQDAMRWAQGSAGQGGTAQNGQNRQSSPDHQPFVSNLGRKAEAESESLEGDSDALYA